jgi:hypothetical protein
MQQRNTAKAVAVLLLATVALVLSGCGKSARSDAEDSVFKLNDRAHLRQVKKGETPSEKLRIVQLAPDGITKTGAIIQYVDGRTALVHYRTEGAHKGTMSDAQEFFAVPEPKVEGNDAEKKPVELKPLESTLAGRKLRRDMQFDVDGHTFLKDTVYDENGTLVHAGKLTAPTIYDAFDFVDVQSPAALKVDIGNNSASRAVLRHVEYTLTKDKKPKWVLAVDETYFPDGVHQTVGTLDDGDGSFVTLTYTHESVLVSKATKNQWGSELATEFYETDGKTLKQKVTQTVYSVILEHYASGVITDRRMFSSNNRAMEITFFVAGKERIKQTWSLPSDAKVNDDGTVDGSKYVLDRLQLTNPDGSVKVIELADDHKTPKTITILPKESAGSSVFSFWVAHTTKTFRADGTLEKVEVYKAGGKIVSTKTYTAAQNVREPIPQKYLQAPPFEQPPKTLPPTRGRSPFFGGFPMF